MKALIFWTVAFLVAAAIPFALNDLIIAAIYGN